MPPYFKSRLLHKCKSTKSIIEDVSNSYKVYKNQIYSTGLNLIIVKSISPPKTDVIGVGTHIKIKLLLCMTD